MALILNIETALENASVWIADNGKELAFKENSATGEQASWLHNAITEACKENNIRLGDIDAIAVSNGPGSYTGLRIGLATAKGLCYALNKPLICLNTLEIIAHAAAGATKTDYDLICPMIDARRMEVFLAIYKKYLKLFEPPTAKILSATSFSKELISNKILFCGSGSLTLKHLINHPNATFLEQNLKLNSMLHISENNYIEHNFSELAYSEPFYLKPVYFK